MKKIFSHLKEFWYMYGLLILIIGVTYGFGLLNSYEEQNSEELFTIYTITEFEREEITGISYLGNAGQELSFVKKEDGTWVYGPDETLTIEQDGPLYLVELLKNITSEYQVENPEDMSIYGLSEASPYIQIDTAKESKRIYIGEYNATVKRYYAYVEGQTTVYGVKTDVAEVLDYTLSNFTANKFK